MVRKDSILVFMLLLLIVSLPLTVMRDGERTNALSNQQDVSFFVNSFALFAPPENLYHETSPYIFDAHGNIHSIGVFRDKEGNQYYYHLWTNCSSGHVESHKIDDYEYFSSIYSLDLGLYPNVASGGIDFVYWRYNSSTMTQDFFQYSWNATGMSTTRQIAIFEACEDFDLFATTWNGTHPFIFHFDHSDYPLWNLSVKWPGETDFQFSGVLEGSIFEVDLDENENPILWTGDWVGENTKKIIGWNALQDQLICVANVTISEAFRVTMSMDQKGDYWLLVYSVYEVTLNRFFRDVPAGNFSMTQEYQQALVVTNHDIQLGVRRTTPFITYLGGSPDLGSASPVPFLGYWTSGREFVSTVLDTKHQNSESWPRLYNPLGGESGIVVPYMIEDLTGYYDNQKIDVPAEIKENNLDPNQAIYGTYLAANISTLEGIKPAIFNLHEAKAPLLPSFWPWIAGAALVGLAGGTIGYWRYKRMKEAEQLIDTLEESLEGT